MAYPVGYDVKTNHNFNVIKRLWHNRDDKITRIAIRQCIKWIKLDIMEHKRWA